MIEKVWKSKRIIFIKTLYYKIMFSSQTVLKKEKKILKKIIFSYLVVL